MDEEIQPVHSGRQARVAHSLGRLHHYRRLVQKYWWMLPAGILLGVGVQGYLLLTAPDAFVSVARMIVNIKLQIPTGAVYAEELSNFLGTQVALMQSDTVRNRALARVRELPFNTKTNLPLTISVSPKTSIFNLRALGPEAGYTQAYLKACIEEYMALKREMRSQTSETTLDGIMIELRRLEQELQKGEQSLLSFQSSNSVVLLQEQGGSAGSYLGSLNRQLTGLRTENELLKALNLDQGLEWRQKKGTDGSENSAAPLGEGADYLKIKQEIYVKMADKKQLGEFLRPKHPRMIGLNDDIDRLQKLVEIFRQQSMEQLTNRLASLDLQINTLEKEYKNWEVKSLDISRKVAEYEKIKANNERSQNLYKRLLEMMQTLGVTKEVEPESVAILEQASKAIPSRASTVKALALGGTLGLALAIGILLLIDRFDDRLASFSDVEEVFDEPILGQVPFIPHDDPNVPFQLIHSSDDRHAFVEAYRNLRSSLIYMAIEGRKPRTILVTSAVPGDGKSMTIANLAIVMAQGGSRVLLVDADLRKGIQQRLHGVKAEKGLSELLNGKATMKEVVLPTSVPNLFLVGRGAAARNSGELFLGETTRQFLKDAQAEYDYVLIDSPPVMAADDVSSLAPTVEGVIFVLRANVTSTRAARASLELLYQRQVSVLGLVFNGVDPSSEDYYYYYRYKDYYAAADAK